MIVPVLCAIGAAWAIVASIAGAPDALLAARMRARLGAARCRRVDRTAIRVRIAVRRDARAVRRSDRSLPDLLDGVVRQLRSGSTIRHALERVAGRSDHDDLKRLAADLRTGAALPASLASWRGDRPRPDRRLAAVAVELAAQTGGATARVLDGVAESLRDRVALEREVTALSTQARASAVVLVLAPIGFALLAITIDPRLVAVLRSPVGIVCVLVGLVLDGVGAWWMSRLVGGRR